MKPLSELSLREAPALVGLVFDLDDTLLDGGALSEGAYGALFRLREAGLRLVACTGRPAGWGEVIQRQWPLDATVTENGAMAFVWSSETSSGPGRVLRLGSQDRLSQRARRAELAAFAEELLARFPDAALADDNDARETDVTLDIGEHRRVGAEDLARMQAAAHAHGFRTHLSSVHLHLSTEGEDKASGVLRLLAAHFGEDPGAARYRYAFVGDSGNDAPAFAAFTTTFGVDNIREWLSKLTILPRFVAPSPRGRGFAEIAARLAQLRAALPRE